jgi:hypothetical protein
MTALKKKSPLKVVRRIFEYEPKADRVRAAALTAHIGTDWDEVLDPTSRATATPADQKIMDDHRQSLTRKRRNTRPATK